MTDRVDIANAKVRCRELIEFTFEDDPIDAATFFLTDAKSAHQIGGAERNMAKVADQVSDCVNLRNREGDAVASYLSRLARANGE